MRTFFYNAKDNIKWRPPSHKRLFHRLGEYDTMAEFVVLSERFFEDFCEKADSFVDFVNTKAVEYNVNIKNGVSLENYREALYKSFMVNSHAMLNDFLDNFRDDLKLFVNHDFVLIDRMEFSKYERLIKSMQVFGVTPRIPIWLDDIINYYRLVRNHVAHNENDETVCIKAYEKINIKQMCIDYPVFQHKAPNPPGSITMDDFYLYSASIKHIANLLTISIQGCEKWTDIGKYHPLLKRSRIPSGTNKRKLLHQILNQLGHRCIKEEVDKILVDVRNQYNT